MVRIAPIYLIDRNIIRTLKLNCSPKDRQIFNLNSRSLPEIKDIITAFYLDSRRITTAGINPIWRQDS